MLNPFAAFSGGRTPTNKKKRNSHMRMAIFFTGLLILATVPPAVMEWILSETGGSSWDWWDLGPTLSLNTRLIVEGSIIGAIVLINTVMAIMYGIKAKNNPEEEEEITYGLREDLRRIKGVISLYPSLTMEELAEKADIEPALLETKLLELALSGHMNGQIDPGSGRIISKTVNHGIVTDGDEKPDVLKCPYCFAPLKSSPVRGTSTRCPSCGRLVVS